MPIVAAIGAAPACATNPHRTQPKRLISEALARDGLAILPPQDALVTLKMLATMRVRASMVLLDPWYNKGVGGVRDDYATFVLRLVRAASRVGDHVVLWGFPEILAGFVPRIPTRLRLVKWLTWSYRNIPPGTRGWRSGQQACLHLSRPGASMFAENFLTPEQREARKAGAFPMIFAPYSVIDCPVVLGVALRNEKTGHPAQKPERVIEWIMKMTTREGELVIDPMSGSGTTGAVAKKLGRQAILCDISADYTKLIEGRLGVRRVDVVNPSMPMNIERLTPEEQEERRRRAVTLVLNGSNQAEAARQVGASREAVRRWMVLHRVYGDKGLAPRPHGGTTSKLTDAQRQRLQRVLAQGALKSGFEDDTWTGVRVAAVIRRLFDVSYHPGHAARFLKDVPTPLPAE